MTKIKVWKVVDGPYQDDLCIGEEQWLVVMATEEGYKEPFDFELMLPDFNSAYKLSGEILQTMEPIEIDIGNLERVN